MGQESGLSHFRSTLSEVPQAPKASKKKTSCGMLCTWALKDLTIPPVPDEVASESCSPCERKPQQQLLPKEEVEEGRGKKLLIEGLR